MSKLSSGKDGFDQEYWEKNYNEPEEMDNIYNAKEHAEYMRALFALQSIDISTVVDLGFGLGVLFKEVIKTFKPYRVVGIEPSEYAFNKVSQKKLTTIESIKISLYKMDLLTWCRLEDKKMKSFDLGLCTSVFQYLSDDEIREVLPVLSQRIKYLYFSVPTDLEYKRQISEMDFFDEFAIHRSKEEYLAFLEPHFSIVSSRILESKYHFDEESTSFTDLLFKF